MKKRGTTPNLATIPIPVTILIRDMSMVIQDMNQTPVTAIKSTTEERTRDTENRDTVMKTIMAINTEMDPDIPKIQTTEIHMSPLNHIPLNTTKMTLRFV